MIQIPCVLWPFAALENVHGFTNFLLSPIGITKKTLVNPYFFSLVNSEHSSYEQYFKTT